MGLVVIGDEGSFGWGGWVGAPVVPGCGGHGQQALGGAGVDPAEALDDGWHSGSGLARSVMSAATASAVPPAASIVVTSVSGRSLCRAMTATLAPCSASFLAVAAPMPLLAPVTIATVLVKVDGRSAWSCQVVVPGAERGQPMTSAERMTGNHRCGADVVTRRHG